MTGARPQADQALVQAPSPPVSALPGFDPSRVSRAFLVLAKRVLGGEVYADVGDVVFDQRGYDYGLARDDSFYTGIEHISVTKSWDGGYPGFTIAKRDLSPLSKETAVALAIAIDARSDETRSGSAEGESAAIAQGDAS